MNAVIYARYSCDNQTEQSIEGQLRECMEYAARTGVTVIENYIDRAYSAKTDNRPEFQRMIKDSYKHCFDMIIVWKLDRFARNRYDSAHYKNILKKNDVKVISATEAISEGSEGILLESVLEGMAEYYSKELSEKVLRGMKENALHCRVNGGYLPYGYIIKDRKLVIEPTEAAIVREIFEMCANGMTAKEIYKTLGERHITKKNGKPIQYNAVIYMLSNRTYAGDYKFKDMVVPHGNPAIIDDELFERVQLEVQKNAHAPARHKAEDDYLLTTKLFCGKCGAFMVGDSGTSRNGEVHRYYKCVNAKKKTCDKKTVTKEWIENLAVEKALEILNDEVVVDYLVHKIYDLQGEENPRVPRLKAQLAETEKKISNMISAIEQGIILTSTKTRLAELEKEKSELEIVILQEQIKKPFLTEEQIRFGIEKFRKLDISTKEGKKRLIDGFINAIYLYDDKVTFTFNYKDSTKTISLTELNCTPSCSDLKSLGAPKK
jgi:DNA invertase Pin-like site-specific DNA recombinase